MALKNKYFLFQKSTEMKKNENVDTEWKVYLIYMRAKVNLEPVKHNKQKGKGYLCESRLNG